MNIYKMSQKYEDMKKGLIRHSLIQIYDNSKLTVEECKKVILFDENTIILELSFGNTEIVGLDLKMKNFSERGVVITGKLHSLKFTEKERNDT